MTSLLLFTALVCLLVDHSLAVVELTDTTFYEYAKGKEVLLVDFFAPWCSDCKALDPDFESAAASLGTRSLDLAKVDCFGAGKGLCATYGVRRWPTLKNFNRGQYTGDYNGGLTASEIAGYITTVENSVVPAANPYAMVVPQPIQQACISRCKINRFPNKGNCLQTCRGKSFATHNGPKRLMNMKMVQPKPVINEKSCAKCRIPQPTGRSECTSDMMLMCIKMDEKLMKGGKAKLRANSRYLDNKHTSSKSIGLATERLPKENHSLAKVNISYPPIGNKNRKVADHLNLKSVKGGHFRPNSIAMNKTGTSQNNVGKIQNKTHNVSSGLPDKINSSAIVMKNTVDDCGISEDVKEKINISSAAHVNETNNVQSLEIVNDHGKRNDTSSNLNQSMEIPAKNPEKVGAKEIKGKLFKPIKEMDTINEEGRELERNVKNSSVTQNALDSMSPKEALKMPYMKDDK